MQYGVQKVTLPDKETRPMLDTSGVKAVCKLRVANRPSDVRPDVRHLSACIPSVIQILGCTSRGGRGIGIYVTDRRGELRVHLNGEKM
jgi:hypothetical protein